MQLIFDGCREEEPNAADFRWLLETEPKLLPTLCFGPGPDASSGANLIFDAVFLPFSRPKGVKVFFSKLLPPFRSRKGSKWMRLPVFAPDCGQIGRKMRKTEGVHSRTSAQKTRAGPLPGVRLDVNASNLTLSYFARFAKRVYLPSKRSLTVPSSPLRCLPMITSPMFLSSVSG